MQSAFSRLVTRFVRHRKGVAAVEFALIVPVMLLIYIGTMEASALISVDRKVQSVSSSMGDLVSRSNTSLPAAQLRDYFHAASGIMTPYSARQVNQTVTAIAVPETGEPRVIWSKDFAGGATQYSDSARYRFNDIYELPESMVNISRGRTVIAAEASYAYTPFFGIVFNQPVNLYRSSFYIARFMGSIAIE